MRNCRVFRALVVASVVTCGACDNKTTTPTPTPTPTPAPAPAPAPAPPPPAAPAALESVTLSASEVPSQGQPTLTIKLTAAAPAGNAVITLNSSHDAVKVPSNTSIAAGATSTSLTIDTATVNVRTAATISATYQGVTMSAAVTVLPPPLVPRFTVASPSVGSEACSIVGSGGNVDCALDGSPSSGFPISYIWTLTVVSGTDLKISRPEPGPFVPVTTCGFLAGASQSDGKISLSISLQVEDRDGNRSSTLQRTVPLVTNHNCGY